MIRWEHLFERVPTAVFLRDPEKYLDAIGGQGWELVQLTLAVGDDASVFIFWRRPRPPPDIILPNLDWMDGGKA